MESCCKAFRVDFFPWRFTIAIIKYHLSRFDFFCFSSVTMQTERRFFPGESDGKP